jgi:hypothetical protein
VNRIINIIIIINPLRYIAGIRSKMDNPEKPAPMGTQDEEKQNKNTTQYVLDTTMRQTNTNNVNKTLS